MFELEDVRCLDCQFNPESMSASGAWTTSAYMVRYGSNHTGPRGSNFILMKTPFREASLETAATLVRLVKHRIPIRYRSTGQN